MSSAHENEMYRIITSFAAACAAPTKRFRRGLCAASLAGAIVLILGATLMVGQLENPSIPLAMCCLSMVLLAVSLRLAFNDMRDLRRQHRLKRRELFVSTFSDEDFQQKVREERAKLRQAGRTKDYPRRCSDFTTEMTETTEKAAQGLAPIHDGCLSHPLPRPPLVRRSLGEGGCLSLCPLCSLW